LPCAASARPSLCSPPPTRNGNFNCGQVTTWTPKASILCRHHSISIYFRLQLPCLENFRQIFIICLSRGCMFCRRLKNQADLLEPKTKRWTNQTTAPVVRKALIMHRRRRFAGSHYSGCCIENATFIITISLFRDSNNCFSQAMEPAGIKTDFAGFKTFNRICCRKYEQRDWCQHQACKLDWIQGWELLATIESTTFYLG
jgi:hypothetical protein